MWATVAIILVVVLLWTEGPWVFIASLLPWWPFWILIAVGLFVLGGL